MRKSTILPALAATVLLGGCAQYGLGGLGDILGGDPYDDRYDDRNLSNFERDAIAACQRQAGTYGRTQVTDVDQNGRDTVEVRGRIDTRDSRSDEFYCVYRSDRRVVEFRIS